MEEKTLQQSLAELKRILNLVEEKAQYAQYKHLLQKGIDSAAWTLNTTLGVIQHSENRDHVRTRLHIVNLIEQQTGRARNRCSFSSPQDNAPPWLSDS